MRAYLWLEKTGWDVQISFDKSWEFLNADYDLIGWWNE